MIYMIILAFSLSIDAIGIGLSYGIRGIKIPLTAGGVIGIISFFVIFCSMVFGKFLCNFITEDMGEITGTIILLAIGIWIIFQSIKRQNTPMKKEKTLNFIIKPLGITIKIIRTPESCDLNKSSIIEPFEAIYLGAALSFDSIGVGITSSTFGFDKFIFSLMVCMFQIILLNLGTLFGKKINKIKYLDKISNILSGGILISIAMTKLFLKMVDCIMK